MSLLIAAAAVLSCGLNATPDGTRASDGSVALMNAPIPDQLLQSLATGTPPPPTLQFAGEPMAMPEWIIRMPSESNTRFMIARLSRDLFTHVIRVGWIETRDDGTNHFIETARGTCNVKEAGEAK